jgi:hypothetical protein
MSTPFCASVLPITKGDPQILHLSNFFELKRTLVYIHAFIQLRNRKVLAGPCHLGGGGPGGVGGVTSPKKSKKGGPTCGEGALACWNCGEGGPGMEGGPNFGIHPQPETGWHGPEC